MTTKNTPAATDAPTPNPNLALWNRVVHTDPAYTKGFSRAGGFKGTAINFVYLARKATEVFGPVGIGWGHEVISEEYREGASLEDASGNEVVHIVRIRFWYELNGKRGEFQSYGQTTFVGENSKGVFTDEEAPKKSLTDALSKAMSWLGFGADVHLGLFDDNKYVNDRKREFGSGKEAIAGPNVTAGDAPPERIRGLEDRGADQGTEPPAGLTAKERADIKAAIEGATDAESWESAKASAFAACQRTNDADQWAKWKDLLAKQGRKLKLAPASGKAKANGNGAANAAH